MKPRTRWVIAVTAAAFVLIPSAGIVIADSLRDDPTPAQPAAGWSTAGTTNTIHTGPGPAFPATLPGWQLADEWTDGARVFADWVSLCTGGTCPHPYPATMNGCANQRFLIRWRTTA